MKESNFLSAVIYVHDNGQSIYQFLEHINKVLLNNFQHYEILCIDDDCEDQSVSEVRRFAKMNEGVSISIVHMSFYHGLEKSMNAGIDLSIGDFVLEFDCPVLNFEDSLIMEVYTKSTNEGYDVVNAVPKNATKTSSAIFYRLFNKFSQTQCDIQTDSFRITSRRMINRVKSASITTPYRKVLYAQSGLKQANCMYEPIKGIEVTDTAEARKTKRSLAIDSFVLFTDFAYKGTMFLTIMMLLFAMFAAIYTTVVFLTQRPQAGWTTTMLFLSVSFFALFAVLTIMLKYLSIIMELIFKKSKYLFEEIEKL